MHAFLNVLSQGFVNIAPLFILLGLLIFVHEFGHFIVARLCGVRVETFSLGFGKKILRYKPGETTYCLSIIPLGGYVKMFGDDPSVEVPKEEQGRAFLYKRVSQRIAIVLAGPLMNLVFAVFLFMLIARIGEDLPAARVGDVPKASAAYTAGFRTGDKILNVDGVPVESWPDVQSHVEKSAGFALQFTVTHDDGSAATLSAVPVRAPNDNILSLSSEVGKIDGLTDESLSSLAGAVAGKPAALAGLNSLDLVTAVNGHAVNSFTELREQVTRAFPSGHVVLKVRFVDSDEKPDNFRRVDIATAELDAGTDALATLGIEPSEMYVLKVKPGSPAAAAGILAKDRITEINGQAVNDWNDVLNRVKAYDPQGNPVHFVILRGSTQLSLDIRPELTALMNGNGQEEKRFTIGVVSGSLKVGPEPVLVQAKDPIKVISRGVDQTREWTGFIVMSLVRLAQGQVSAKNIGGVITIGRVASRSFEVGISAFLKTMSIISINLFLLNLLPVPVLDGGHLLFFGIEALRGTPISLKRLEIAQQVGLTLLLMLMAFALFNDISNFIFQRW